VITISNVKFQAKAKRLTFWLAALMSGAILLSLARPAGASPDADGDLDTTFGGTGKVTTTFALPAAGSAVAVQANGKIGVAGYVMDVNGSTVSADFALARYNSNGTPDTTFDGDGTLTTDFGGTDSAYGVTIQPDGKIIVVGSSAHDLVQIPSFAIARYNSNGTIDTTFDGNGKVLVGFQGLGAMGSAVVMQPNGKILVAGYAKMPQPGPSDFAVARLNSNGTLDTDFSGDGMQTTNFGGDESASAITIQPDGKIVLGGKALVADAQDFALARYNTDGTLDSSFDTDGKVTTDISFGASDSINGLALASDGKIVAAGTYAYGNNGGSFALARYTAGGILDNSFDGDGRLTTAFGGPAYGQAVVHTV
jgi:serralysin